MNETKSNSNTTLLIIGSLIIGGLIVFFLLKSKTQPQSLQTLQPTSLSQLQINFNQQLISLENKLNNIEQQLQTLQSIQLTNNHNNPQQPLINTHNNTTYKNSEKTNFILNKDGDIIGIETVRDVKIG